MRKNISGGARQAKQSLESAISTLLALISREYMHQLSSTPPVYIHKAHQDTSGSAVSELMRFIHHIITYVVPAVPRAINWSRPLIQKPPVTGWAGALFRIFNNDLALMFDVVSIILMFDHLGYLIILHVHVYVFVFIPLHVYTFMYKNVHVHCIHVCVHVAASIAQLVRVSHRKQMLVGSSPTRGSLFSLKNNCFGLGELCCVALSFCCVVLPCLVFLGISWMVKVMYVHVHVQYMYVYIVLHLKLWLCTGL